MSKVGELASVGAAWFYPKGVSKILSQFRMVVHSSGR